MESTELPPKPSEKQMRALSSEEENQTHVLIDDTILKDLQTK